MGHDHIFGPGKGFFFFTTRESVHILSMQALGVKYASIIPPENLFCNNVWDLVIVDGGCLVDGNWGPPRDTHNKETYQNTDGQSGRDELERGL